jgi:hypothetical protein
MMRETSGDLYDKGAPNTDVDPNNYFFYSDTNKKKRCRVGMFKCCGVTLVILGMNALSFYIGYLVKDREDGSDLF